MMKQLVAAMAVVFAGVAHAGALLSEGFENVAGLAGSGWVLTNNSSPAGGTGWFQGNTGVFDAAAGPVDSYVGANFNNAAPGGAISNWLLTPSLSINNGDILSFSLRLLGEGFIDTVEVYLSTSGASSNVGVTATSTGDFSLLETFSSDVDTGWTDESITVAGLGGPATGRYAFRYVVGNTFVDGNYIGIDSVSVVPEPASLALVMLAMTGMASIRRRSI